MTAHDRYPDPYDGLITSICALRARSRSTLVQGLETEEKCFFGMMYAYADSTETYKLEGGQGGMYGNDGVRP